MLTVEQRVQRGIAFMDIHADSDWRPGISLEDLIMSSSDFCILGQRYGNYFDALCNFDHFDPADYGFTTDHKYDAEDSPEADVDYCCRDCNPVPFGWDAFEALQREWVKVLS